ncbi:hypothetical protein AB0D46_37145 [Streptomyces sp. NPDC048383]|uniref:hypothetical protein n=1 Tax=Streptomyces sp. NPDC048383 TaxID=3155386 RepID=UPI003428DE7F
MNPAAEGIRCTDAEDPVERQGWVAMAGGELTAGERAAWEQLEAQLRSPSGRPPHSRRSGPGPLLLLTALLLCAALVLIPLGVFGPSGAPAWAGVAAWIGVAAWVAALVTVSVLLGHGGAPYRRTLREGAPAYRSAPYGEDFHAERPYGGAVRRRSLGG